MVAGDFADRTGHPAARRVRPGLVWGFACTGWHGCTCELLHVCTTARVQPIRIGGEVLVRRGGDRPGGGGRGACLSLPGRRRGTECGKRVATGGKIGLRASGGKEFANKIFVSW